MFTLFSRQSTAAPEAPRVKIFRYYYAGTWQEVWAYTAQEAIMQLRDNTSAKCAREAVLTSVEEAPEA